jgi:hypothetical protein
VISQLRNKLIQDRMASRNMSTTTRFGLIIKAWNIFRLNKTVKLLKFDPEREPFPSIV